MGWTEGNKYDRLYGAKQGRRKPKDKKSSFMLVGYREDKTGRYFFGENGRRVYIIDG